MLPIYQVTPHPEAAQKMMDQFLNSLLQIVIVLDVFGLLAYFVIGALKRRRRQAETPAPTTPIALTQPERQPGRWRRLRQRLSFRPAGHEDLDAALGNLRRVLYSYQQGLA